MKKNLVYPLGALILGMSLSFQSCDKEDDIDLLSAPEFVQKTFSSMYPDVNYAEWEQEKATKNIRPISIILVHILNGELILIM